MSRKQPKPVDTAADPPKLAWQKAAFHLHSFAYRDPRSAFASGIGLPVVSPTTVLLGVASSLFSVGEADAARAFLAIAHHCEVLIDAPDGVIFFRAFHQLRRYETMKWGHNPRFGMTKINQGTREYGLVDGLMTIYIGVPEDQALIVGKALTNLRHLGTSDSLCSLVDTVANCRTPDLIYLPREEFAQQIRERGVGVLGRGVTTVTLSRFKKDQPLTQTLDHWKMSGDQSDTELTPYVISGFFEGTSRGKIYRKRRS